MVYPHSWESNHPIGRTYNQCPKRDYAFFWIILTAIVMQRLIFEVSLEQKFLPTLFIFIAPPSVFVVDFYAIFGFYNEFSLLVYFIGLFFCVFIAFP